MKLSQKQLERARTVYDLFWDSYMAGDLDAFSDTLDEKFEMIGTSESERCHTKAGGIEFFKQQKDELIGKAEMRNRKISTSQIDGLVLIIELCDIYTLAEKEWSFYSKIRISTLLRESPDGWKVTQQHGSFPDMRVQEGETLAIDKIHRDNLELRDAVKRRTAELENKKRELEIEAAIERVRVQSMAMQHPDDLNRVNQELLNQLNSLQVEGLTGVSIWLIDEDGWVTAWDLSSPGNMGDPNSATVRYNPDNYDLLGEPWRMIQESNDDYFVLDYPVEKLEKAIDEWKKVDPAVASGFREALANGKLTHQWNPIARHSHGIVSIDLIKPPSADTREIVTKMAGAFSLAYRRFLDLQKAEAQAREAQIEAALEKVRSRSLAMHKSEELVEVDKVIIEQIKALEIELFGVGIHICHKDEPVSEAWMGDPTEGGLFGGDRQFPKIIYEHNHDSFSELMYRAWKQGESFLTETVHGDRLKEHMGYVRTVVPDAAMPDSPTPPELLIYHLAYFSQGFLVFVSTTPRLDEYTVFIRLAKVFEQAYSRFIDLQKAEAQAREAQIIASMERVRAAAMAMHNSSELSSVLSTLFEQFDILDIHPSHAVLTLINKEKNTLNFRTTGKKGYRVFAEQEVDLSVVDAWVDTAEKWKKSTPNAVNVNEYPPEILPDVWEVYGDIIAAIPKNARPEIKDFPEGLFITEGYCKFGYIGFAHHRKPTDEEKDIVRRIAAEFGTLYQRYLELQKAEAQAREAEIQLALERVRARTMSMQKSDELGDVIALISEQMETLQIPVHDGVALITFNEDSKDLNEWMANEGFDTATNFHLPFFDHPVLSNLWKAREQGLKELIQRYSAEENQSFLNHIFQHTDFRHTPEPVKEYCHAAETYATTIAFQKNTAIFINDYSGVSLTDTEMSILHRFAKEFDQTYTRFLDLQKAEAQAREAQIETALEKVRSRSIGMQTSAELQNVVKVIFNQLAQLNINAEHAGIVVDYEPKKDWSFWVAETQDLPAKVTVPYLDSIWDRQFTNAKKTGTGFFTTQLNFEEKNSFYKTMLPYIEGLTEEAIKFYFNCPGLAISTAIEKDIGLYIENFSGTPYTEEENVILKRFAKVFQQTYTRFLDLQKAEEQAREAQIETALEKVRSRSLAMHKSNELIEVVSVLFEKLKELQIPFTAVGIATRIEGSKDLNAYVCGDNADGLVITNYRLPYFDNPIPIDFYNALEKQLDYFTGRYSKEEKDAFYEYVIENTAEFRHLPEDILSMIFESPTYTISTVAVKNAVFNINDFEGKELAEHDIDVIKRFAKVFDQAYTRFLDLQKAEEQTREAQVNLAVERVRAKALAMFKSEEILQVVTKLRDEIMGLEIPNVTAATIHLREPDGRYRAWDLTSINDGTGKELEISLDITYHLEDTHPDFFIREVWEKTDAYFVVTQGGDRYQHTSQWLRDNGYATQAQEFEEFLESSKLEKAYHPTVQLNNGRMCIDMLQPPDPEVESILKKMAGAFDLAYKRFEDLQKAEAQARESEIQLALERVRARTMAMKKSDELREAVLVIYEQLEQLHFEATGCNIIIMDKESGSMQYWVSGFTQDIYPESYHVPFFNHPYLNAQIEPWKQGEKYAVMEYSGEEKKRFDEIFFSKTGFKNVPEQAKLAMKSLKMVKLSTAYCRYGALQVLGLEPLSEKKGEILRRFAKVFEQTYTRFLDLQKAEAQTREVQIEAALERARAQSMMMQHSDEINTISNAFHEQLNLLGIPSEFSYVWLPDEANETHQFWASWSEVKAGENSLQSKQVTYPLDKSEPYTAACFEAWANPDVVLEEFIPPSDIDGFFDVWKELLAGAEKLKAEHFPEGIYYSEAYMRYGCFGINIRRKLSEQEKNILKRFSKEFERAYTRFLDLQKSEEQALLIREERDRLEIALNKLHATQDQLIQQEKLASLGQLTAGIAHEIKNPLNFVNNFSDVSIELVEEAREEVRRGTEESPLSRGEGDPSADGEARGVSDDAQNLSTILEILDDIENNLRKIHEHGSRADGIVKSMLQHSRGSDGKMEPTNLNALIKEYVNLAFHGMRAGKNPINVDIDLQLDQNVSEISLVAEDFSRVILNLCNNGFDAMREKQGSGDYEPKLTVRSFSNENTVSIEIEDNGSGIPDEIRDKILQPFFTTKKGTQGTGLGLSITHDIVKAHGGSLGVHSQQGKTVFTIKLTA